MSYIDDAPAVRARPRRLLRSAVGTCLLVLLGAGLAVLWRSFGEPLWQSWSGDVGVASRIVAVSEPASVPAPVAAPIAASAPPPVAAPLPQAAPAPAKSREADEQLARIARDLEAVKQSMERLGAAQQQMAQSVAALEARQQEMAQRLSALQMAAPRAPAPSVGTQWLADPSALATYYTGALRRPPSQGTPAPQAANGRPPPQSSAAPPRAAAATPAPRPRPNPTP